MAATPDDAPAPAHTPGAPSALPHPSSSGLQAILDRAALEWNTSFSVGIYTKAGSWTAASGFYDRATREPLEPHHRFPVGSVTKTYTCAAVMQAYEKGLLDIDLPISLYVDPILLRENGTTMLQLWHNDSRVTTNCTVREVMGMRAGLQAYDDVWYHNITLAEPSHDVTPIDLVHRLNKTWVTKWEYSSPGYELLGLALAQVNGAKHWYDYDQMGVLPPGLRRGGAFGGTTFPGRGWCSKDPLIVHQYANTPYHWGGVKTSAYSFFDIVNTSCLNGWTCGNLAATPLDIARFHYELQHEKTIVSEASLRQMNAFWNWSMSNTTAYGLGIRPRTVAGVGKGHNGPTAADPHNLTYTIGHEGADYGSRAPLAGYNVNLGFGVALVTGSELSMNCSSPTLKEPSGLACEVVAEAVRLVSLVTGLGAGKRTLVNCSLVGKRLPSNCSRLLPTAAFGCNATVHTRACAGCVDSAVNNATFHRAGCGKADVKAFCGPVQCGATLALACPAAVRANVSACMPCALNASTYRTAPSKTYPRGLTETICNESQRESFCGSRAVSACSAAVGAACGHVPRGPACLRCADNTTDPAVAPVIKRGGCTASQKETACDVAAVCNASLARDCGAVRGVASCAACAARRRAGCLWRGGTAQEEGFCRSCAAVLHSACGHTQEKANATGNATECLACLARNVTKSTAANAGCGRGEWGLAFCTECEAQAHTTAWERSNATVANITDVVGCCHACKANPACNAATFHHVPTTHPHPGPTAFCRFVYASTVTPRVLASPSASSAATTLIIVRPKPVDPDPTPPAPPPLACTFAF